MKVSLQVNGRLISFWQEFTKLYQIFTFCSPSDETIPVSSDHEKEQHSSLVNLKFQFQDRSKRLSNVFNTVNYHIPTLVFLNLNQGVIPTKGDKKSFIYCNLWLMYRIHIVSSLKLWWQFGSQSKAIGSKFLFTFKETLAQNSKMQNFKIWFSWERKELFKWN